MKKSATASKTRSKRKPKFKKNKITDELRTLDEDELTVLGEHGLSGCLSLLTDFQHYRELLDQKLCHIDEKHISEIDRFEREAREQTGEFESAGPPMDLVTSIRAIVAIQEHLINYGIESKALERLRIALGAVLSGNPPPMFLGPPSDTRPFDAPAIQEIKGILAAAMVEYQTRDSLQKTDAANAVIKNIPRDLKPHLSRNEISARTIIGWREKFGGKTSSPSYGQKSYQKFRIAFSNNPDSHAKYLRLLMAEYAEILPNL